jgi:alkylated DNA repair dioxygenase AlkB
VSRPLIIPAIILRAFQTVGGAIPLDDHGILDRTPMSQLPLFAGTSETVLVNDERGRITYTSDLIPADVARRWFAELRESVRWQTQRRRMYDREVDVPRLMAHFRLDPEESPAPEAIPVAAGRVAAFTRVAFNSVGLNFYRDGGDSVAPHNDDLDEIVEGCPIALLSLGATRRMTIRAKEPPRQVLHIDLEAGSLLVMSYETQRHYTHGIPKTRERVGPRISLAFRVRSVDGPRRRPAGEGSDVSAGPADHT